jgi:hypothetical protein
VLGRGDVLISCLRCDEGRKMNVRLARGSKMERRRGMEDGRSISKSVTI